MGNVEFAYTCGAVELVSLWLATSTAPPIFPRLLHLNSQAPCKGPGSWNSQRLASLGFKLATFDYRSESGPWPEPRRPPLPSVRLAGCNATRPANEQRGDAQRRASPARARFAAAVAAAPTARAGRGPCGRGVSLRLASHGASHGVRGPPMPAGRRPWHPHYASRILMCCRRPTAERRARARARSAW